MSTKNSKEQVNIILLPFLKLDNETYLLDVSEDKATEMGGSKEDFQEVLNELEVLNNFVKDAKSDPKHEVTLFDPQKTEKATFAQPQCQVGGFPVTGRKPYQQVSILLMEQQRSSSHVRQMSQLQRAIPVEHMHSV